MKPSFLAGLLLAGIAHACMPAAAGSAVLSGTLAVPPAPAHAQHLNAYPGQAGSMASHRMSPRGAVGDAVLWLEGVPAGADSAVALPPRPKLAQVDQCFMPRVVTVPVGGTVDFPNMDPIYHNVFSVSATRRFDLGKYPKGHSKSVMFPKAGVVNVYCDIHSDMAAFVIVTPNRAAAQPRADGAWTLPDVPPGRYVLHVWHPDFGTFEREVDLGTSRTLALSF